MLIIVFGKSFQSISENDCFIAVFYIYGNNRFKLLFQNTSIIIIFVVNLYGGRIICSCTSVESKYTNQDKHLYIKYFSFSVFLNYHNSHRIKYLAFGHFNRCYLYILFISSKNKNCIN